MPVTASVTGCSTWRRAFISRKYQRAVGGEQELGGAGAGVADARREGDGRVAECGAQLRVDRGRRRLLDHLLVAALQRAVALAEVDHRPAAVGEHLHLDVAGASEQPLEEDPRRRRTRPRPRAGPPRAPRTARVPRSRPARIPRPPPPAAALTSSGNPSLIASLLERVVGQVDAGVARHDRHAGRLGQPPRRDLVAQRRAWRSGGGPTNTRPAAATASANSGALGQEPVAGVDGVGAGRARRGDQRRAVEVRPAPRRASSAPPRGARRARPASTHGNRGDPELAAGADDPHRDLAAVGDQDALVVRRPSRLPLLEERRQALLALGGRRGPPRAARAGRAARKRAVASRTSRLASAIACGPHARNASTASATARVEPRRLGAPRARGRSARALGVEALAGREQRPACARADLAQHERRDRRRDQPEPHLGEPEPRARARRRRCRRSATRPDAAAERVRRSPGRSPASGQSSIASNRLRIDGGVGHVLLVREVAAAAHPVDVGARAERGRPRPSARRRACRRRGEGGHERVGGARRSAPGSNALRRSRPVERQRGDRPSRLEARRALTSGRPRSVVSGDGRARGGGEAEREHAARVERGRSCRRPTGARSSSTGCPPARSARGWRRSKASRSSSDISPRTVESTRAACAPPITEMRAFGHIQSRRGP